MRRCAWFLALPLACACSNAGPAGSGAVGGGGNSAVSAAGRAGEPASAGGGSGGTAPTAFGGAGSAGESVAGSNSAGVGGASNAGTAGASGSADPGQPFVDAYTTFVTSLRRHYPKARQYLVVSPMLGGTNRALLEQYIANVVSSRTAAGDKNITRLEFAPPAAEAWGCGHPNAATHAIMATVLEAALHADLGW